jgi:serine/threonine-protein kinase
MHCHLNEPPPRPSDKVQEIPRALDDLVVALMAKNPASRPWDAAAAESILVELRDKASRNEAVPMVWPEAGSPAANPTRAGVGPVDPPSRPRKKGKKGGGSGTTASASSRGAGTSWASAVFDRVSPETLGLLAALFAIGGFIAYWVWPPGAEYLYRHAIPLMESTRHSDRVTALEEYIEPLDRRFPDHPYHAQTQAWRDMIAVDEAERRSKMLESTTPSPFSEPKTHGELQYVAFFSLASKAAAVGREDAAAAYWREMIGTLDADDPDDRKWILLAQKKAEELEARIRERRAFVEEQLQKAAAAARRGRPNEAIAIHAMLMEKFSQYSDLADLLAPALPPQQPPQPTAPPAPAPVPAPDAGAAPEPSKPGEDEPSTRPGPGR